MSGGASNVGCFAFRRRRALHPAVGDHGSFCAGVIGARDGMAAAVGGGEGGLSDRTEVVDAGSAGSVHFQPYQTMARVVPISMALKKA